MIDWFGLKDRWRPAALFPKFVQHLSWCGVKLELELNAGLHMGGRVSAICTIPRSQVQESSQT